MRALHFRPSSLLAVCCGGVAGTALRDLVERSLPHAAGGWPLATFVVNLAGALVLGALLEHLSRRGEDVGRLRTLRLLLGTGFCGGLTTFSTLAVEVDLLMRAGHLALGAVYLLASLVAGVVAAGVGYRLAVLATPHARRTT